MHFLEIRIRRKVNPGFFGLLLRVFLRFAKLDSGIAEIYFARQLRISGSLFHARTCLGIE